MKPHPLIKIGMVLLLILCLAGALWTAYWTLRFGLTPRPPLSAFQTVVRFVVVALALLLRWLRRDRLERIVFACTMVAAGSSALYGLGMNSVTLQVVRLLFHFLAYSLAVAAIIRWFRGQSVEAAIIAMSGKVENRQGRQERKCGEN